MTKQKKYRFRCPICGLLSWEHRLENRYPLELVDVQSNGRGLIRNIFLDWGSQNSLHSLFQKHFYDVLNYLLINRYVDANVVKELAELYVKPPTVFHPNVVFKPNLVYRPKLCKSEV